MQTKHLLLVYTVASFISVTAYEMYQATLADYNFGIALACFQSIMLLVLQWPYPAAERKLLGLIEGFTHYKTGLTLTEAFRLNPKLLSLLGVCSSVRFGLMLPFLSSLDNSLLFIIFFSLSGLLKVPVAMWVFGDQVGSRRLYSVGLILATLGGMAYAINPGQQIAMFNGDWMLLLAVLVRVPLDILESILTRYVATASPTPRRVQAVPVEKIEAIKAIFTIVFGLIVASQTLHVSDPLLPNSRHIVGILWIGVVVTFTSTFSTRLVLKLTHTLTQPIMSLRPMLAFIPFALTYLADGGVSTELFYKLVCLCVILFGTAICLRHGLTHTVS